MTPCEKLGYKVGDRFETTIKAKWDWNFIGVDVCLDTYFGDSSYVFGDYVVEITFDQIDEHLGLTKPIESKKHKYYDLIVKWAKNTNAYYVLTKNSFGVWCKPHFPVWNPIKEHNLVAKSSLDIALAHLNENKEVERCIDGEWITDENPSFDVGCKYRVKPEVKYKWRFAWWSDNTNCWGFSKRFNSYEYALKEAIKEAEKLGDFDKVEIQRIKVKYQ